MEKSINMNVLQINLEEITLEEFGLKFDHSSIYLGQDDDSVPEFTGILDLLYDEKIAFKFECYVTSKGYFEFKFFFQKMIDISKDYNHIVEFNKIPFNMFNLTVLNDKTLCIRRAGFMTSLDEILNEYKLSILNFKENFDELLHLFSHCS